MREKARLIDIAKALNVSTTTVSRALNNKSDISPKTKEAVLSLARKLDYQPNNLAISLRKKRSFQSIGVILPNVGHYFFSTVLKGIMQKAHLNNYLVMVGESNANALEEEKLVEEFVNYGVNGILITPGKESNYTAISELLQTKRIPHVLIDRTFPNYNGNYVLSNDIEGAKLATNHLLDNGCQRIAYVGILDKCSVCLKRYSGYLSALKEYGIPTDTSIVIKFNEISHRAGFEAARELFSLENPPDSVFAVTDNVAAGVIDYCHVNGIDVPNQLAVVGFSNSEISSIVQPKLTTIEQKGEHMGELAFDYFYQSLVDKNAVMQKTFDLKLIVRESSVKER